MAAKANSRIVRRQNPPPMTGHRGYSKAKPFLRKDFEERCAYCMMGEAVHPDGDDGFEIDHFWPTSRKGDRNSYDNLFWSCAWCNRWKSNRWPTDKDVILDRRFVNPCNEQDYGDHFTELPDGTLKSSSTPGEYHIKHLRLNRDKRVALRKERDFLIAKSEEVAALLRDVSSEPHANPSMQARIVDFILYGLGAIKLRINGLPPQI